MDGSENSGFRGAPPCVVALLLPETQWELQGSELPRMGILFPADPHGLGWWTEVGTGVGARTEALLGEVMLSVNSSAKKSDKS